MRHAAYTAALLSVTTVLLAPVIGYGFVYEDRRDAHLTLDASRLSEQIRLQPFRAITSLSRVLDMTMFGIQPWAFHLGSLLWHLVNVALVFALAVHVLPFWGALAAAGIFAWHPLQVEAVAYVSARSDLLATTGVLLALLAASAGSSAGALVGVAIACLSKEAAIMAWGLVPLWAWWTRAPLRWVRWSLLSLSGGALAVWWLWDRIGGLQVTLDSVLAGHQLATIWRLAALLVVPWGFTIDHDWQSLAWLGPSALILSLGLTAWCLTEGLWSRSWLALAWLWTLGALLPRLFVPLYEGLHEHHMMMPMVVWCLCAGHYLSKPMRGRVFLWRAV